MIWRRLLITSEASVAQLHEYIQIAFVWSGEHLHCFRIQGRDYGIAYLGGISFEDNPREIPLSRFRLHAREPFRYEYDFTANWRYESPFEALGTMAAAMRRWLDAGRHREALGDIEELGEALERVTAYREFQPRKLRPPPDQSEAAGYRSGGGRMIFQIRVTAIADDGQAQVHEITSLPEAGAVREPALRRV